MAVQSAVRLLLVAVKATTVAQSLAVDVARFAMDLTVFFGRHGWPTDRRGCLTRKRRWLWSSATHAILGGQWQKNP